MLWKVSVLVKAVVAGPPEETLIVTVTLSVLPAAGSFLPSALSVLDLPSASFVFPLSTEIGLGFFARRTVATCVAWRRCLCAGWEAGCD
jgi:hypothetical protein